MIAELAKALYQYSDAAVNAALSSASITGAEYEDTTKQIAQLREQRKLLAALPEAYVKAAAAELSTDQQVRDSITQSILQLQIEKGTTREVIAAKYEEILVRSHWSGQWMIFGEDLVVALSKGGLS